MKNNTIPKPPQQGGFFLRCKKRAVDVIVCMSEVNDFKNEVRGFTDIVKGFNGKPNDFTNEVKDFKSVVNDFTCEVRYFIHGLFKYKTKNKT